MTDYTKNLYRVFPMASVELLVTTKSEFISQAVLSRYTNCKIYYLMAAMLMDVT